MQNRSSDREGHGFGRAEGCPMYDVIPNLCEAKARNRLFGLDYITHPCRIHNTSLTTGAAFAARAGIS
jgi:hypothetical protein